MYVVLSNHRTGYFYRNAYFHGVYRVYYALISLSRVPLQSGERPNILCYTSVHGLGRIGIKAYIHVHNRQFRVLHDGEVLPGSPYLGKSDPLSKNSRHSKCGGIQIANVYL